MMAPGKIRRWGLFQMRHLRRVIGGFLVLGCATLVAQQAQQPPSSLTGAYTAQQAAAGEKIYFEKCAVCHGDDLEGREKATALAGAPFMEAWGGKDLRQLLDRIETMPPVAPKSLPAADYVAVLAFLLRHADIPSGSTPLPTDRVQLSRMMAFGRATAVQAPAAAARPPAAAQ